MRDFLLLIKKFHDNEINIIENGRRYPDGSKFPDWFGKALRMIADNNSSFIDICMKCHVP